MKYRKSMIILVLAVFIFGAASVSASDVNDTIMAGEDTGQMALSVVDEMTVDNLQTGEESNILAQTGNEKTVGGVVDLKTLTAVEEGNFSQLREEIGNGGDKNLTKSYYRYYAGERSPLIIRNSGVINGNGAVIDMAGSDNPAFVVYSSDVTIKNLTIINSKSPANGGAIIFDSSGTVENCTFINNTAQDGGAVYFPTNTTGRVINCNFINNNASELGGAVLLFNGTVTNCTFINNTANLDADALFVDTNCIVMNCNFTNLLPSDKSQVVFGDNTYGRVINSNFINNAGGAIIFVYEGAVMNCNFTNVLSSNRVISIHNGNVTNCNFADCSVNQVITIQGNVTNCTFINNTVGDATVWFGLVGAVTNCTFINNTVGDSTVIFEGISAVTNCNFTGNNAHTGSAISFMSSSATKTISNSIFLNNKADVDYNTPLNVTLNGNNIEIIFMGQNNLLNAIYSEGDAEVTFVNVTYWGAEGITKIISATLSGSNREAGQNITVSVVVNDAIILDNKVHVTDVNGEIVLKNINLDGNYFIRVRHDEDSYYTEAEKIVTNMKFSVNVTNQTTNNRKVNITAKSNILNEVMPGKLLFILPNGTEITATYGGNGTWWAVHSFDDYGVYQINASYIGLDNITINNATIAIKLITELTADEITTTYNINKDLVITLTDNQSNPLSGFNVTVDLNGLKTYVTDGNGQVKVPTNVLTPNVYTAKISFDGNDCYVDSSVSVKVTVNKATPKLTAKAKTFKTTTKTKKYTVTLKDNTGKALKNAKVTLKVNGKTYKAKTNSKGKATFKITKLTKKGTYKATITFKGDKNYKKVTKKAKIRVIVTFKTVSRGSKDKSTVKEIQQALKDKGYYLSYKGHYLMVDGKFESCTERSVKQFQHDKGLKVTGKVDEKTAKKLGII